MKYGNDNYCQKIQHTTYNNIIIIINYCYLYFKRCGQYEDILYFRGSMLDSPLVCYSRRVRQYHHNIVTV